MAVDPPSPNDRVDNDKEETTETETQLTRLQRRNILFLVLAFSCVVASVTVIVGTGAVVIISVGGCNTLAPFALGVFMLGQSMISLFCTHWLFSKWGRKVGFHFGSGIALLGVGVGLFGITQSSPTIVLLSEAMFGAGTGILMYLRFAAVEVVPPSHGSRAVTWTLCGGCLAAFVGPQASHASKGVFGDDHLTYLGVFVVSGCFYIGQIVFVSLIRFPTKNNAKEMKEVLTRSVSGKPSGKDDSIRQDDIEMGDNENDGTPRQETTERLDDSSNAKATTSPVHQKSFRELRSLLLSHTFYLPLVVSIIAWTTMAMPMSIFRVAMNELGYKSQQSLTVIQIHFFAMYSPGFYTGGFLKRNGPIKGVQVALLSVVIATGISLSAQDNTTSIYTWYLGLIFLGIGWNFGYSSATVWVTKTYQHVPVYKEQVQAANECLTMLISGAAIFSTGYLYDAAGGGEGGTIKGWSVLNYTMLALSGLLVIVVLVARRLQQNPEMSNANKP